MTLQKAIELNNESEKSLRAHKFIDHADAVKLGNEALLRIQVNRGTTIHNIDEPLPTETKD